MHRFSGEKKKGEKKAWRKAYKQTIQDLLEIKFPQQEAQFMTKVKNLRNLEKLEAIKERVKAAKTLDELQQSLF